MTGILLLVSACGQAQDSLTARLDSLFARAARWEVGSDVDTVRAARDTLALLGDTALDYVFENKMKTVSGLELRALENLFKRLQLRARPRLVRCFTDPNDTVRANAFYLVGKIKDTVLADTVAALLKTESSPRVKRSAIDCLGRLGLKRSAEEIRPFLSDTSEKLRFTAGVALGRIGRDFRDVMACLHDRNTMIRQAGLVGLQNQPGSLDTLLLLLSGKKPQLIHIKALGLLLRENDFPARDTESALRTLILLLENPDPVIRAWAVWAVAPVADQTTITRLSLMLQTEDHPLVKGEIENLLRERGR